MKKEICVKKKMNNLQQKTTSQESIRPTAISDDCLPIPDNVALFLIKHEVYYDAVAAIDSSETSRMVTSS